jgi:thiamine-monophosphate kinase
MLEPPTADKRSDATSIISETTWPIWQPFTKHMNEFEAIRSFFEWPTAHTVLGVGDDAALCAVPEGQALAISSDMLVEGRHFFADVDPESLGHKALAVNLSDMAAMGAEPKHFTLALALPAMDTHWLERFAAGLKKTADAFHCDLIGGDTTAGPLNIAITVLGHVPHGQALRRSGAQAGDDIYVSGALGAARLALWHRAQRLGAPLSPPCGIDAARAMDWPTPRVALGLALRGVASAAMDLSDGLAGDLRHLAQASQCDATVSIEQIPVAPCLAGVQEINAPVFAAQGGDDYELLFTAPSTHRARLQAISQAQGIALTRIGVMSEPRAHDAVCVRFLDAFGHDMADQLAGFDHFESTASPFTQRL